MPYKLAGFYSWFAVGNTKPNWKFMIYDTNLKVHGKNQNLSKVHDIMDQFPKNVYPTKIDKTIKRKKSKNGNWNINSIMLPFFN